MMPDSENTLSPELQELQTAWQWLQLAQSQGNPAYQGSTVRSTTNPQWPIEVLDSNGRHQQWLGPGYAADFLAEAKIHPWNEKSTPAPAPAPAGSVQSRLRNLPPALTRWQPLVEAAAKKYGLDPALLFGVMQMESGGNPSAVSAAGATGLMQVVPLEAGFGGRPSHAALLDPATNVDFGARILSDNLKRWGSPDKAVAAYLGAIDAKGNITGGDPYTGISGNQYVKNVLTNAQNYGPGTTPMADEEGGATQPQQNPPGNLAQTYQTQLDKAKSQYTEWQSNLMRARGRLQDAINADPSGLMNSAEVGQLRAIVANAESQSAYWQKEQQRLEPLLAKEQQGGGTAAGRYTADIRRQSALEVASLRGLDGKDIAEINQGGATERAKAANLSREEIATLQALSKQDVAELQSSTRERVAELTTQSRERVAGITAARYENLPELQEAQAEQYRQATAMNKAKLDLLAQTTQEVQTALDLPPGPERLKALEAIGQKYATINDPQGALSYLQQQAQLQFNKAKELSNQTGYQYDLATLQPLKDAQGNALLTEPALQARYAVAQQQATEATRSAQAMLPYLAPAGTGADLAALNNAYRTGGSAPAQPVRTGQLPAQYDPTKVGPQVFQSMLQHLAPGSPLASQLLQSGQVDPNVLNQPTQGQTPVPAVPPQEQAPISELLKRYGLPTGPTGTGMALPESVAVG